jgi:glycosyltransferase involved in cell wall biosynthesis
MKKIKVLVLTTSFPLAQDSVSGLFVKRLIDSFPPIVKPLVITPCDNNNNACFGQFGYEVKCFKYAPKKFRVLAHTPGGVPAALQTSKFHFILIPFFLVSMFTKCLVEVRNVELIHANWSICGVIGGLVGRMFSKPVITTLRGEDVNKANTNLFFNVTLKLAIKYSCYIVCVSQTMVKNVKLISADKKFNTKFISNGVSKKLTENYPDKRPAIENKLVLVSVGSLTKNKNTILIIEAVKKLINQKRNVVLNIVGDGPCKSLLIDMIEKYQLQNHIHLHGARESRDVYEIVSRSNIFVLSSFREGRPNVVLESMALGTLVIASKIEGVEEIIENEVSGLLFNPYSCDELVECINRVSDNKTLQKDLPKNALEYIISNSLFWDETAKQYLEIYNTVLAH